MLHSNWAVAIPKPNTDFGRIKNCLRLRDHTLILNRSHLSDQPAILLNLAGHIHAFGLSLNPQSKQRLRGLFGRERQLLVAHLSNIFDLHGVTIKQYKNRSAHFVKQDGALQIVP